MNIEWSETQVLEELARLSLSRVEPKLVWLQVPFGKRDPSVKKPGLIAFGHGASGDSYQMPIPFLAGQLADAGYTCVSMDGPVHGLRQKGPGGRAALGDEMKRATVSTTWLMTGTSL